MNELATTDNLPLSLRMDEGELISILSASLYPGASVNSVRMVLGYCRASGLDPMLKPVHIVPMDVATGEKDADGWPIKEKRDIVMPGVGLYRTNAAKTGEMAGKDEPEFGPVKELPYRSEEWVDGANGKRVKKWIDMVLQYPEWCKVTVYRYGRGGHVGRFTAKEFWLENYAQSGRGAPNAMWKKRPFAQLAKCAEAQALRSGFPENGAAPTAEEMEGKTIYPDHIELEQLPQLEVPRAKSETMQDAPPMPPVKPAVEQPQAKPAEKNRAPVASNPAPGSGNALKARASQINLIRVKLGNQDQIDEQALCADYGIQRLDDMLASDVNAVLARLQPK